MEKLLTYIWKYRLMYMQNLFTTDHQPIEIIDVGIQNTNAGPDFFNAKIRIDGVVWAGNVEIHTKSSDWFVHQHNNNAAYNSVILHVIKDFDKKALCLDGHTPPHFILTYPESIEKNYQFLLYSENNFPCQSKIHLLDPIIISLWKNALLSERLERKTRDIDSLLEANKEDWEEVLYLTLARYFGFGINNDSFGQMARLLPLSFIRKHRNNLFQIESMFFGQAGLLNADVHDSYAVALKKEFYFLQKKFNLKPLEDYHWKMLRLRPSNFPHVRIAEFASFMQKSDTLFSKLIEIQNLEELRAFFRITASEYWDTHYSFTHESPRLVKHIGEKAVDVLIINVAIPLFFSYGKRKGMPCYEELAIKLLEELPAERNYITHQWQEVGFKIQNAFDSQAFIQLKKEYCDVKKCLYCRFGHKLLTIPSFYS